MCNGTASCIGYVVFLVGKNNNCSALMWRSGKAKRICKSTESAEMMALGEGIEESIYVKTVIINILSISKTMLPITCITDHRGLWDCIHSTHLTEDRRLRIDVGTRQLYPSQPDSPQPGWAWCRPLMSRHPGW